MTRVVALVTLALAVGACADVDVTSRQAAACSEFVVLNEGVAIEDPEDVAPRNVAVAEQVQLRLDGTSWGAGDVVHRHLLDAARSAEDAGRAWLRQDIDVWLDGMGAFIIALDAAHAALRERGIDCGSPLRFPASPDP